MMEKGREAAYLRDIKYNIGRIYGVIWEISPFYIPLTVVITILMGIQPTISVIVMQNIMNLLQAGSAYFRNILFYVVIYIMIDILFSQIQNLYAYYTGVFQLKVSLVIGQKILEKTDELTIQDFENSESYNKIQRALQQSDIQVLNYFSSLLSLLRFFTTMVSSAALLFLWKWWIVLLILGVSSISSIIMIKLGKEKYHIVRKRTGEERQKWYYQYLLTNDIAFKEIKIYELNQYFKNKYKNISEKFIAQDKKILGKITVTNVIMGILESCAAAFAFVLIILDTFGHRILIGSSIAYIRYMANISSNVKGFLSQIVSIFSSTLYMNQLFEFLDMEKMENDSGIEIEGIHTIEINNLSYKYKGSSRYAIKNISLSIKRGERISIVGMNGSGKSTLVKILVGLYNDYEGEIYINSLELKRINKNSLKRHIGILFQDFTKYELSLRENIGVGNLKKKDDDLYIKQVGRLAKVKEELLHHLDQQLGSWFKEGKPLSGGEWIRIGIGRAVARDADMYIFDEPNASLDTVAEKEVFNSFKAVMKDKIGIIITHRILSAQILEGTTVVMHEGEIIGKGSHEMLLKQCEVYRKLYANSVS